MESGIYCIENLVNGKKYIGQTSDFLKRWKNHKQELQGNNHENTYLQNAWNKHGEEHFEFWIIEEYPPILEILKLMEIYFIEYFCSFGVGGYNLTRGGDGNLGWIPKDETREKISRANSGENHPNYGKRGEGTTNWGNHHTLETRKIQSESNIARFVEEKSPNWGITMSPISVRNQIMLVQYSLV